MVRVCKYADVCACAQVFVTHVFGKITGPSRMAGEMFHRDLDGVLNRLCKLERRVVFYAFCVEWYRVGNGVL